MMKSIVRMDVVGWFRKAVYSGMMRLTRRRDMRRYCVVSFPLIVFSVLSIGSPAHGSGQVIAGGYNNYGQCDVPADAQTGVAQIAAGGTHSLALKDGKVIAWGANDNGECTVPADAQSGVTQIAAGEYHSLALKNGKVIAWGYNFNGQCDVPADAQSGVTQIARGYYHSLALKDGKVIAWGAKGDNYYGQCDVPADAQSGVTQIAGGYAHSMALKDGKVIAWGGNPWGQLDVPADAQSGVTQIAAGGSYSLALKTPPLGIKPGPLTAGSQFTLGLSLTQSITRAFDLYLIADTPNGPYTIFLDGRIVAGIQPLYRNVRGYAAPYSVTVMSGAEIPSSMSGAAVCFYVVTVDTGKMPPVSSLQDLVPRSLYVITFDAAQAAVN